MKNKYIPEEINEQYNTIHHLNLTIVSKYEKLCDMVLERSNELFESIVKKVPKIKRIPLFYSYFDINYNISYDYVEALTDFEEYALNNNHLEQKDLDLIEDELIELRHLADILIHYMGLYSQYETYELVYHCADGREFFGQIETLIDCFNE